MSGTSWTNRIIRSWSHNSFKTFESIRNDLKARTFSTEQAEAKRCWMPSSCVNSWFNRRKGFLNRIMTSDKKWIHYNKSKCRRSWGNPCHASTSAAKPNIHGLKLLLCIWWDQLGVVYYELLKVTETITWDHYQLQLMCLSWAFKKKWHNKVIL